ncbi:MAG: caspase family protein, partial [Actinomycetes bacterium]|nr:caspase family protein [Actinomycetes bacterium]
MSRLVALLVGIDAYRAPVPPLRGCVNDVEAIAEVLRRRVPADALSLAVLRDGEATRMAVIAGIRAHLGSAGPGDVALFHYSGHGSQQDAPPELWEVEPDRRIETLVLADSRAPGRWDLADKELAVLLGGVAASGAHVLTVLDCCHSGGGTRTADGVLRLRQAPADTRARPLSSFLPGVDAAAAGAAGAGAARAGAAGAGTARVGEAGGRTAGAGLTRSATARWSAGEGSQVLLAACRSTETAKEVAEAGQGRGALSAALEATLREGGRLTYRQVHRHVTGTVMRRVAAQHPQLEVTDAAELDRAFLGGAVPPSPRLLVLSRFPDGWSIDAGAVHGMPDAVGEDATSLAIHPLGSTGEGAPLATATVTRVLADRSLVAPSVPLDEHASYSAVVTSLPLPALRVWVRAEDAAGVAERGEGHGGPAERGEGRGGPELRAAAREADATLVTVVDDPAEADVVVTATPAGFAVTRPGGARPVVPPLTGEGRAGRTMAVLEHVARWLRLARLHNPATRLPEGAVEVAVEAATGEVLDDGSVAIAYDGGVAPSFSVRLRNTTAIPLWCALIDLTEAYGIFTDAFPAGVVALGPGEFAAVELVGQVPDEVWSAGTTNVTDQLLVVTSTVEFDPRSLEQEELGAGGAPVVVRG